MVSAHLSYVRSDTRLADGIVAELGRYGVGVGHTLREARPDRLETVAGGTADWLIILAGLDREDVPITGAYLGYALASRRRVVLIANEIRDFISDPGSLVETVQRSDDVKGMSAVIALHMGVHKDRWAPSSRIAQTLSGGGAKKKAAKKSKKK